jgi:hypothetical protein
MAAMLSPEDQRAVPGNEQDDMITGTRSIRPGTRR